MIQIEIDRLFPHTSSCGLVDKIYDSDEWGHTFKYRAPSAFLFFNSKIFYLSFKFLNFLRSLDRFKVLFRVVISEIYMAWRKISLEYLLISGGRLSSHAQTLSTSLMPRLVNATSQDFSEDSFFCSTYFFSDGITLYVKLRFFIFSTLSWNVFHTFEGQIESETGVRHPFLCVSTFFTTEFSIFWEQKREIPRHLNWCHLEWNMKNQNPNGCPGRTKPRFLWILK